MFALTSMDGKIDMAVYNEGAPYVFRLNGHDHHRIGSLCTIEGSQPTFAQLYIFDMENEVRNMINSISSNEGNDDIDPEIVNSIIQMLNRNIALVKALE